MTILKAIIVDVKHNNLLRNYKGIVDRTHNRDTVLINTVESTIVIKNLNSISVPLIENSNEDAYNLTHEDINNILIPEGLFEREKYVLSHYFINLDFSNNSTKKLIFFNKHMADTAYAELKSALSMPID